VTSQKRQVFEFLTHFNWPLNDLLACLEQNYGPKTPLYSKFQELQKKHESPTDGIFAREKLPRTIDRELFATLENDS